MWGTAVAVLYASKSGKRITSCTFAAPVSKHPIDTSSALHTQLVTNSVRIAGRIFYGWQLSQDATIAVLMPLDAVTAR